VGGEKKGEGRLLSKYWSKKLENMSVERGKEETAQIPVRGGGGERQHASPAEGKPPLRFC